MASNSAIINIHIESIPVKPSIYPIAAKYPGRLFIMPKPSGEWLQEDIQHYRNIGIGTVISMLEPAEVEELSLQNEPKVCAESHLDFINYPIPDRGLPDKESFKELVQIVRTCLDRNESVAVHCRAGIGRSGMLVCCALAGFISSVENVIELVSQARGVAVPDTKDQRTFIKTVVRELTDQVLLGGPEAHQS